MAVLDAHCSHLGADLGRGHVVGDCIQCPFHGWEYGVDGRCTRIPAQSKVPAFARQTAYPAIERHGALFFFNGRRPLFPLPFFLDEDPATFVAGRPFGYVGHCPWHMIGANAFDCQHLSPVHGRELVAEPLVDSPHPFARRIRYRTRVTGASLADRLIRPLIGGSVAVEITVWGGNFALVAARFARAQSFILFSIRPVGPNQTRLDAMVLARRRRRAPMAWLTPLELAVRRWMTQAFVRGDFDRLAGIRYNPHSLIEGDRTLADYFAWAASLPRHAAATPLNGHAAAVDRPAELDPVTESPFVQETSP
jgi:hypothetical protein